jgi:hypothetical protein
VRNSSDLYRVLDKAKVRARACFCCCSRGGVVRARGWSQRREGCVCSWACVSSCPTPLPFNQTIPHNLKPKQQTQQHTGRPGLGHPRLARQLRGDGHRRFGGQRVVIGFGRLIALGVDLWRFCRSATAERRLASLAPPLPNPHYAPPLL